MLTAKRHIDTVKIFVTSLGNHFMIEIAQIFLEGFKNSRVSAEIAIDEIPAVAPKEDLLQIIIAPHEFYNLFLDTKLSQPEILEITKAVYMLSAEQPLTVWFEMAYQKSIHSKGVLDITQQTTDEYSKRGILAIHTPLGYAPCLEEVMPADRFLPKSVDILFLGSHSHKREFFLSKNAGFFSKYNSQLIITRLEKPKFLDTPGFYANYERNRLLKSSKIIVNVHSVDNTYFEWLRILMAIANRCLVISELSDYIEPLVNGKHLIVTELENIVSACEYYLENDDERMRIVEQAYQFVTKEFTSSIICRSLLDKLNNGIHIQSYGKS